MFQSVTDPVANGSATTLKLSPETSNLLIMTSPLVNTSGLNSLGILSSGGMGAIMAELIATGDSSQDVTGITLARTQPYESTRRFLADRTPATLGYVFSHAGLPHYKQALRRTSVPDR